VIERLVDSHVHFWHPEALHYEWLGDVPLLNRPFVPKDLAAASAGLPLERIVFVQADCVVGEGLREAAWVSDLAVAEPRIGGIVAFAPLDQPDVADYLAELRKYRLVRGVRRLIQSEAVDFAANPDLVRGVQSLAALNLSFDICIRHEQMPSVISLVRSCPDVRFILDHAGKPGIKDHLIEPWAAHLRELASLPNVWCKLSGLITEADFSAWTPEDLQPYVDHVLDCFGTERVMFGGDWPVVNLAGDYALWLGTAAGMVGHLPAADQDRIFYSNACKFYSLD
jgi:L-fuconolactonase